MLTKRGQSRLRCSAKEYVDLVQPGTMIDPTKVVRIASKTRGVGCERLAAY